MILVPGEQFEEAVADFGAVVFRNADGGVLDLLEQTPEVVAGARDSGDAQGCALPDDDFVELGDGNIELMPQTIFKTADALTPVFEGVGVFHADFEREHADGHAP